MAVFVGQWYVGGDLQEADDDNDVEITFNREKKDLLQWTNIKDDTIYRKKSEILCTIRHLNATGKSDRLFKLVSGEMER